MNHISFNKAVERKALSSSGFLFKTEAEKHDLPSVDESDTVENVGFSSIRVRAQ